MRSSRAGVNRLTSFPNRESVQFPEDVILRESSWGEQDEEPHSILVMDTGSDDPDRIVIFSNPRLISMMKSSKIFQGDGTFKICPPQWHQLYTIHCWNAGRCIPVIYALLPNSNQHSYRRLMSFIQQQFDEQPNNMVFIIDLELAVSNVILEVFQDARISFCFFHFQQCHWRKIQELGHQTDFGTDIQFALKVKRFSALAFLPLFHVFRAFDLLYNDVIEDPRFEEFTTYFESTFIGQIGRNASRRLPRFPPERWSQYENITNDINRTNNRVEGWNNRAKNLAECLHPHPFRLIELLKKDMASSDLKLFDIETGRQLPPQRQRYSDVTTRLKSIVTSNEFEEDGGTGEDEKIMRFLTSAARIINY